MNIRMVFTIHTLDMLDQHTRDLVDTPRLRDDEVQWSLTRELIAQLEKLWKSPRMPQEQKEIMDRVLRRMELLEQVIGPQPEVIRLCEAVVVPDEEWCILRKGHSTAAKHTSNSGATRADNEVYMSTQ